MKRHLRWLMTCLIVALSCALAAHAQTTTFTYQGRLTDGATAASGAYHMQFALFDAASAGAQIGATQTNTTVSVTNGVFAVLLDFGAAALPGANRYLEISVKRPADAAYTTLAPRQQLTSTPYAVQSLNATTATNAQQLNGQPASQYVLTGDARLTDARPPAAGSANYVQNTTSPQASANFNIAGDGTAGGTLSGNLVNAATQYNLGGGRVLSVAGSDNIFAGINAGTANIGNSNSFVGALAGSNNTTGNINSFVGASAGKSNETGSSNSFAGAFAGSLNMTGSSNSFVGRSAGNSNKTGSSNTIIGAFADVGLDNLTNATAIGADALVTKSNSLVLGSISGENSATVNTKVGIGTTAPAAPLHVKNTSFPTMLAESSFTSGTWLRLLNTSTGGHDWNIISSGSSNGEGAGKLLFNDQTIGGNTRMILDASGNLTIDGRLTKGSGSFKIDHPLDPANKTLSHSFVESPDMLNIYNGNITTDQNGEASVTLPAYFDALNRDFRYQLTVIGQFAQAIVGEKIKGNRFVVKTDKPRVEVSWQVTGVRQDKFAEDQRIAVEEDKPAAARGKCLYAPACQFRQHAVPAFPR